MWNIDPLWELKGNELQGGLGIVRIYYSNYQVPQGALYYYIFCSSSIDVFKVLCC